MKHANQKGFAALEAILILVIVAVIAGAGYFVWKHRQDTSSGTQAAAKNSSVTPATADYQKAEGVSYTPSRVLKARANEDQAVTLVKDTYTKYLAVLKDPYHHGQSSDPTKSKPIVLLGLEAIHDNLQSDVYNRMKSDYTVTFTNGDSGHDDMTCAQMDPEKVSVSSGYADISQGIVNVTPDFSGTYPPIQVFVNLNTLKIEEVICPDLSNVNP